MTELSSFPIFFLGANNYSGYISRFADCFSGEEGWRVWVLKGGPGSGKSTFMKKAAARLAKIDPSLFLAPCPADPNSLDAVVSPKRKLMILDGTAPHPMEPPLPGISGRIIDTGQFWNAEKLLENKEKIAALFNQNSRLHARAAGYMAAAGRLLGESQRMAAEATDIKKAKKFGEALVSKLIPKGSGSGREQIRFLSGITPAGIIYYRSTAQKLCGKIIEIWDDFGAASSAVFQGIRKVALERGQFVVNCRCPLHPLDKTDHILLPQLGIGFCSVNRYLGAADAERRIHSQRFTDTDALRQHKAHLSFNRKATKELLDCAAEILGDAKRVHDLLEQYYTEAMDYKSMDDYCNLILEEI